MCIYIYVCVWAYMCVCKLLYQAAFKKAGGQPSHHWWMANEKALQAVPACEKTYSRNATKARNATVPRG